VILGKLCFINLPKKALLMYMGLGAKSA
jgi:hypothetical protein